VRLQHSEGITLAQAAETLVGAAFRLHGRDPLTGLDCIGLLAAALERMGRTVRFPSGYSIRTSRYPELAALAHQHDFAPASGLIVPGDVIFTRPGPGQMHLMIRASSGDRFVEAHAGLGRVVLAGARPDDIILQRWRIAPAEEPMTWQH